MDHLGVGPPDASGDSIYNGADAASGLAGLVEIAEAFVALPEEERAARPVLVLAVSGHETGLAGAAWYVDHPTVALDGAVAVFALDRIARNSPDRVSAVGHRYSGLGPLLDDVARAHPDLGLTVVPDAGLDPDSAAAWFRSADALPLARRGVPAILISTGDHEDARRPSDEHGRTDPGKAARVARLAFLAVHRVAASELEPAWTPTGRRIPAPR
ncbi:MAG: M28 family peptidase [Gammaproteobacteria bacterium]|nr:M28 family peptidase [Gammaproteobacteria bacterium]NIY11756.1 M28 family peptidase [Gemmatimonadota bacterium]